MIKDKLNQLKKLIQLSINHKSVKVYKDGKIIITLRFKPNEMLVTDNLKLEKTQLDITKKIEAIINTKYRIIKMQKEPSFCYNTYVRLISSSSATSKDRLKSFLNYFEKQNDNTFKKKSYQQVTLNFEPNKKEEFNNFLNVNIE